MLEVVTGETFQNISVGVTKFWVSFQKYTREKQDKTNEIIFKLKGSAQETISRLEDHLIK